MPIQSPIPFLETAFQSFGEKVKPPAWVTDEVQRRLVLLLNHILLRENEAMGRLSRQKGRVVLFRWRHFSFKWVATPAGLLDLAEPEAMVDLNLLLSQDSPIELIQGVLQGNKPTVRIEGDVQLAAELNWLFDHVRWDLEEDLARLLGDAPAHALGVFARRVMVGVRELSRRSPEGASFGKKS